MPLLILGVRVTEPLPAGRATHRRREPADRIANRCNALAEPLWVFSAVFRLFHRNDTPQIAILRPLASRGRGEGDRLGGFRLVAIS